MKRQEQDVQKPNTVKNKPAPFKPATGKKTARNEHKNVENHEEKHVEKRTEKRSLFSKNKKHTGQAQTDVRRFHADMNEGLSKSQVEERIAQGLVNKTGKKYSKSYRSIFVGNICTIFNLLCLLAMIALLIAKAPFSQYLFVLIFLANITFSIFLEIRAKLKLDKLTILSSPTAKAVRSGKQVDIPVEQIVVDDI